jgi:glycerol-3-phosphate O-acyltransferase
MGRIHVDFGEPVRLDAAPDPEDQLAISKIAFQVAVEANRVTPATFPAVVSTALLRRLSAGLNRAGNRQRAVSVMTEWATARGVRLSPDFNLNYAEEIGSLLANMMEEGIITRFEGGPETVYGIAEGRRQSPASIAIPLCIFF